LLGGFAYETCFDLVICCPGYFLHYFGFSGIFMSKSQFAVCLLIFGFEKSSRDLKIDNDPIL
jgi:hypothetical protein